MPPPPHSHWKSVTLLTNQMPASLTSGLLLKLESLQSSTVGWPPTQTTSHTFPPIKYNFCVKILKTWPWPKNIFFNVNVDMTPSTPDSVSFSFTYWQLDCFVKLLWQVNSRSIAQWNPPQKVISSFPGLQKSCIIHRTSKCIGCVNPTDAVKGSLFFYYVVLVERMFCH